jgi:hypothetical protein
MALNSLRDYLEHYGVHGVASSNLAVPTKFADIAKRRRCTSARLSVGRAGARAGVLEIEPAMAMVAEVGEKSLICQQCVTIEPEEPAGEFLEAWMAFAQRVKGI